MPTAPVTVRRVKLMSFWLPEAAATAIRQGDAYRGGTTLLKGKVSAVELEGLILSE